MLVSENVLTWIIALPFIIGLSGMAFEMWRDIFLNNFAISEQSEVKKDD